jgi:hypothetical protein
MKAHKYPGLLPRKQNVLEIELVQLRTEHFGFAVIASAEPDPILL